MKSTVMMLISTLPLFTGQTPTGDEIVARMLERDQAHQASLGVYAWTSRYVLNNKDRHAEMMVQWTRQADGTKRYQVVYERGDGGVRSHVFHKLLESEVEASQPAFRDRNRLNTTNYSFSLTGAGEVRGRLAYVLDIQPKTDSKYLTRGRIWVDATDYAVVQVEGAPSKKPSFWTNRVNFVQTFEKTGDHWMAACNRSVTEAKLFGEAELVINYFDYKFEESAGHAGTAEDRRSWLSPGA